jgi:transposase
VRVAEEPNIELLRQKAAVLEADNERLSRRISELVREVLTLKGMTPEQVALNLPGLLPKPATVPSSKLTKPGSEQRLHAPQGEQPGKAQRGHGPTAQPNLPVIDETYVADEADKTCPKCGGALEEWEGQEDETELVDVIERQWVVRKRKQQKLRCRCGDCVETAEAPPPLIKGGRYAPGVGLAVATGKYLDQIPLDRQVQMARRQGAQLTTQTLWDQVSALAELEMPLYERIKKAILAQPVIGVDESPFKLIIKGGSVKWQAWQMSAPIGTYFEILSAKSAEMGGQLLKDFKGVAMVDGAQTYKALARDGPFILVNCWSHARRHVLAAEAEAPGQVAQFLDMVGELYAIERKAADEPVEGDRRRGYRHRVDMEKLRVLRDTESRPVIARLQTWILEQQCVPGGALKAGLEYVARRWTALTRFLDNPLIPLDNNRTEAGYIWLAIGRRNYLGARSEQGTRVAGVFYTIFESARICGVDPEAYLRYATDLALHGDAPQLPHEWDGLSPAP